MNRNFTKDTLFNDLPQEMKMMIVELRNAGQMQHTHSIPHPLKDLGHISIPSAKIITEQFLEMASKIEKFNGKKDVKDHFNDSVREFNTFVETYKLNLGNVDILGEMDKTIKLLKCKFEEITANKNNSSYE